MNVDINFNLPGGKLRVFVLSRQRRDAGRRNWLSSSDFLQKKKKKREKAKIREERTEEMLTNKMKRKRRDVLQSLV